MTDEGKQWGTLAEVAQASGVSIDTIRRRMKRGELEARRQQTPQGFKWLALMPDIDEPDTPEITSNAPGSPQSAGAGVQVIERGREELVEELRRDKAFLQEQLDRALRQLEAERQRTDVFQALAAQAGPAQPKPQAESEREVTTVAPGSSESDRIAPTGIRAWLRRLWGS